MNFLNVFFVGTTVGLMALGTTSATIYGQNTRSISQTNTNSINLGTAGDYAILSEWGVSNTGDTKIIGDVGVSPGKATSVKYFNLIPSFIGTSSSSSLVTGKIYAANYKSPTPTKLTRSIMDMLNAYTDASDRAADVADLSDGNIGGDQFPPGVYKWNSDVIIKNDITLEGSPTDIWIFQITGNLNTSPDTEIILNDGAQAKNIYWQVAGETILGANSTFNGTILGQTNITLQQNATLNGRAWAQSKVSLDSNTINVTE